MPGEKGEGNILDCNHAATLPLPTLSKQGKGERPSFESRIKDYILNSKIRFFQKLKVIENLWNLAKTSLKEQPHTHFCPNELQILNKSGWVGVCVCVCILIICRTLC